jgi:tyrosine-specific transport protein
MMPEIVATDLGHFVFLWGVNLLYLGHMEITGQQKKFLHGTAALIGTMVGVGIFGIPLAFAKAGFGIGFLFLVFTCIITLLFNFIFAEIVLRTQEKHQLVGYTNFYLGPFFKHIVLFANLVGIYGALLAYIINAGEFMNNVFSHLWYLTPSYYHFIFAGIVSIFLFFGFKTFAWIEFILTAIFVSIIVAVFALGVPDINVANFSGTTLEYWFLPYGVLLFAFAGLTSIPIQREILRGQERNFRSSMVIAVVLVAVLYLLFAVTVVGISGENTTPNAISGLLDILGPRVVVLGSLFGLLAVTTSYLMLGTALFDIFRLDFKIRKRWAWLLTVAPPIFLFVGGMRNFIDVISLVGAVAIGIESIVLLGVFHKAKAQGTRRPEFSMHLPPWFMYVLGLVFAAGVVYELFIY